MRRLPPRLARIFHKPKRQPYRWANSFRGIDRAKRAGYKQIDVDAQITKDGIVVALHWALLIRDRFRRGGKALPAGVKVSDLTWAEVRKLRSPDGYAIRSVEQIFARARRRGLRVFLEVKGDPRFADPQVMTQVKGAAIRTGCEVRVMTLQNIPGAQARLKAAHAAGFETVLLRRGETPAWASEPYVTYIRG